MEIKKTALYKLALKWGLILGGANILFSIIFVLLELHYSNNFIELTLRAIILVIVPIIALREYKKGSNNLSKLTQFIKIGLIVAIIASVLIISYKLVFTTFIEPDFYEKLHEVNRQTLFEAHASVNPGMTWEQFDIDMAESRNAFWKLQFTFILIAQVLMGLIISTITGLIMRKKEKSIILNKLKK